MSLEKVNLGDIIEIKKGSYITKKESNEGPYPVILGGREPAYYIDRFNHTGKAIVISRSGASAGYVSFWNEPIFVTDGYLIEPKNSMDIDYLYYLLKAHQSKLQGQQGGAAIPHVNPRIIGAIEVYVPTKSIQNRITTVLRSFDALIENNQKQIKLLEEAAQRLYKEWFVDLHFPGHETTPIVDSIPQGWKVASAETFFDISIGKTPPRSESQWFTKSEGIPWISISDMGNANTYIFNTSECLTEEAVSKHNVKVVPSGTVLLSFKLTVGRVSITTTEMCTNEAIAHFRISDDSHREYVYCYLKNFHYDSLGSTSSISKAINSKIVKAMPFVLPTPGLLSEFSRIASPIFEQIKVKQKTCLQLTQARDRLLLKLMSGEIEV